MEWSSCDEEPHWSVAPFATDVFEVWMRLDDLDFEVSDDVDHRKRKVGYLGGRDGREEETDTRKLTEFRVDRQPSSGPVLCYCLSRWHDCLKWIGRRNVKVSEQGLGYLA